MPAETVTVTVAVGLVQSGLLAGIFLRLGQTTTTLEHHDDRLQEVEETAETNAERIREVVRS